MFTDDNERNGSAHLKQPDLQYFRIVNVDLYALCRLRGFESTGGRAQETNRLGLVLDFNHACRIFYPTTIDDERAMSSDPVG